MATTTTNFGWDIPQSTDLVKDGATAIAALGQDIDTAFIDLKGGTTGQVLAKASATDLDYSWTTPQVGDITAVTAGTGISGGGTGGDVTITNSMATAIDAKGDLIAGTGADAFSRIAAGSNGETLFADSSTSTGLRWSATFPAGKNKIINGDFGIWQRGTSFSLTSTGAFTADRFECSSGSGGVAVFSRQTFTPGTDPVNGYAGTYYLEANYTTSGTSTILAENKMEDVTTFANQPMTFSFWGKVSTGTHSVSPEVVQRFGSGGSGAVVATGTAITLTTSWARYTATISVPAITGKTVGAGSSTSVRLNIGTSGVKTFSIWGWQAEYGSIATAFQTATGSIQGELAACQRYYFRSTVSTFNQTFAMGQAYSTTQIYSVVNFPVTMRTNPTALEQSGTASDYRVWTSNFGAANLTSVPAFNAATVNQSTITAAVASGLVAGDASALASNSANAYLGWSAEL